MPFLLNDSKTSVAFAIAIDLPSLISLNTTIVQSLTRPYFKLHIWLWKPILGHYVSSFPFVMEIWYLS